MTADYNIWIRDPEGVRQAIIPGRGFLRCELVREVNGAGLCMLDLLSSHPAIHKLEYDGIVEIQRSDAAAGVTPYIEFGGLYVDSDRFMAADTNKIFRAYIPGYLDLLGGETVAWPANSADRSYFDAVPAETLAKRLVQYNATPADATAEAGRYYTTDVAGITVEADGAHGATITREFSGQNLLAALQDVAAVGGGDFDLVRGAGAAWEYRWYDGQRGTDRSGTVVFALQYNNLQSPKLVRNRLLERTRAVVLGQGAEAARPYVVRTGPNFDGGRRNRTVFVTSSETATAAMQAAGDVRLGELAARDDLQFLVRQTSARRYGRDYFLGDLVTAFYEGVTATKRISQVAITVEAGGVQVETIVVKTANA